MSTAVLMDEVVPSTTTVAKQLAWVVPWSSQAWEIVLEGLAMIRRSELWEYSLAVVAVGISHRRWTSDEGEIRGNTAVSGVLPVRAIQQIGGHGATL
jgi:hypothetical protein